MNYEIILVWPSGLTMSGVLFFDDMVYLDSTNRLYANPEAVKQEFPTCKFEIAGPLTDVKPIPINEAPTIE